MALVNCPECQKEISSKAKTCPHCGCPIEKKEPKKESKKRFHSKEYKMTGIILSIPCSLVLLIFLLGITFNNIIISIIISSIYGLIIYLLSKYLLNTKPHIKRYLWIIIMIVVLPLLISFYLLTRNKEWYYQDDNIEYSVSINGIGGCNYYFHNQTKELKSKECINTKITEGNKNLALEVKDKENKTYIINCFENKDKLVCPNLWNPLPSNNTIELVKK